MKAKKLYFIVIGVLIIILGIVLWSYYNRDEKVINNNEIIPGQEISDEQLRNTIINLYYIDKETNEIKSESKLIDVKYLMDDAYEKIINMWLDGPTSERLKSNCSKNVKLNNIYLQGDCLVIDFSKEFIDEYSGEESEKIKLIYCIVNTMTELNEINSVKILINGQESNYFGDFNLSDKYLRLEPEKN